VSSDVLTVFPTDPYWQPSRADGTRAAALAAELAPVGRRTAPVRTEPRWHEGVVFVDCGSNLESVGCRLCGTSLELTWWSEAVDARAVGGFEDLEVLTPCCAAAHSLNDLDYHWPCGFARFDVPIWNPERDWLDERDLSAIGKVLGHPVRQVKAHY
jgi:hypothetical protein